MKKAGTRPALVSDRSDLLLVHLVHFVGRLLLAVLGLLLAFLLAVLLVHLLGLGVRLLVHLFVLRDRGEAHGRKHRRDEDCKKLLHRHPLLWLVRKDRPWAQSAPNNARALRSVDCGVTFIAGAAEVILNQ